MLMYWLNEEINLKYYNFVNTEIALNNVNYSEKRKNLCLYL